jgi:TolB-like protein
MNPTTRRVAVRLAAASLVFVLVWPRPAPAQSGDPRPAVAVVNLRFDGEHANVLQPGDTAIVAAATSMLLATLAASERVALVDSGTVAAAVAAAESGGGGNPCDNECAVAVARGLGARWVTKGTISNLSNLVWLLKAELFDATTGKPVLADSYELKGDARLMAPKGAHAFAQRVEKAIGGAR